MKAKLAWVFWLLLSFPALSAFRVYQLKVVTFDDRGKPKKAQVVLSTLDHLQYENYYSGYGRSTVSLVDTWYCPGDTSRKEYCKKPKQRQLQRGPAGLSAGKRGDIPFSRQPVIP